MIIIKSKFLTEEGFEEPTSDLYNNIVSKVKEHYGCKNKVDQESKKHGIYLSISQDVLNNEIKNVALYLRQKILKLHEVNLPNQITVEDIQYGQCQMCPLNSLNSIHCKNALAE